MKSRIDKTKIIKKICVNDRDTKSIKLMLPYKYN
jgi:hypothetical protein